MLGEGTREDDQQQNHAFSYLSPETRVHKDRPLRAIRAMVDAVLTQLDGHFTVDGPLLEERASAKSFQPKQPVPGQRPAAHSRIVCRPSSENTRC